MVDTLRLNPLAFPRNPYHSLVKHYRDGDLIRSTRNDPLLDAQLALEVFSNQLEKFAETDPRLLTAWHWLTGRSRPHNGRNGFDLVFRHLRRSPMPSLLEAREGMASLPGREELPERCGEHPGTSGRPRVAAGLRPGLDLGGRWRFQHASLGNLPVARRPQAGEGSSGYPPVTGKTADGAASIRTHGRNWSAGPDTLPSGRNPRTRKAAPSSRQRSRWPCSGTTCWP